jgi:acyl carrier protein
MNADQTILDLIRGLIERRGDSAPEFSADLKLTDDLGLDSLELAELSAGLEDALGRDPYSEGIVPETVGELTGYYA